MPARWQKPGRPFAAWGAALSLDAAFRQGVLQDHIHHAAMPDSLTFPLARHPRVATTSADHVPVQLKM